MAKGAVYYAGVLMVNGYMSQACMWLLGEQVSRCVLIFSLKRKHVKHMEHSILGTQEDKKSAGSLGSGLATAVKGYLLFYTLLIITFIVGLLGSR